MKQLIGLTNLWKFLFKEKKKEIEILKVEMIAPETPEEDKIKIKVEEKIKEEKPKQEIPSYNRGGIEEQLSAQLLKAQLQEQELKNAILLERKSILRDRPKEPTKIELISDIILDSLPYCSISLYTDVITIVWNDGSIFRSPNISIEQFNRIRECKTEEEILKIIDEKDNN